LAARPMRLWRRVQAVGGAGRCGRRPAPVGAGGVRELRRGSAFYRSPFPIIPRSPCRFFRVSSKLRRCGAGSGPSINPRHLVFGATSAPGDVNRLPVYQPSFCVWAQRTFLLGKVYTYISSTSLGDPPGMACEETVHKPDLVDEKEPESEAQQTRGHSEIPIESHQVRRGVRKRCPDGYGN
jgi:hypothetical protein